MAAVTIRSDRFAVTGPHPRMVLQPAAGAPVAVPFAPTGGEWGGAARRWVEVSRPMRPAVLADTGPGLGVVAYTLLVAHRDGAAITAVLAGLRRIAAASGEAGAVTVTGLSQAEAGPWRVTDLGVKVTRREHGTNEPVEAEVSVTLTQIVDLVVTVGRAKSADRPCPKGPRGRKCRRAKKGKGVGR